MRRAPLSVVALATTAIMFGPVTLTDSPARAAEEVSTTASIETDRSKANAATTVAAQTTPQSVTRASGSNRFATSAAISAATFAPGVPVAYLANGMNFPDALSGAAAAGALGGPVLLTQANTLPAVIIAELKRLTPQRIIILGGTGVVSNTVLNQAKAYTSGPVTRASGSNRFATSAAVSAATFAPGASVAYLANGMNFPDALSGAAIAGLAGGPVLLTQANALPPVIAAELERLTPQRIVILGGTGVVSNTVLNQAKAYTSGPVTRASGSNRFATSAAISAATFAPGVPVAYLANGMNFPDALSGAAAAGALGGPVLLTQANTLPAVIIAELKRLTPQRIIILGGTGVVSNTVLNESRDYVEDILALTATPVPVVVGTMSVGSLLTAESGEWAPAPVVLSYQWLRDGAPVNGATFDNYFVTAEDVGASLTVQVTGSKPGYATVTMTSPDRGIVPGSGNNASGTLAADTTWTLADSPIFIDGQLIVPEGITLRIEEGVLVRVRTYGSLEVFGALVIDGSPESRVMMTAAEDASGTTLDSSQWWGITVREGAFLQVDHADLLRSDGIIHFTAPGGGYTTSITHSTLSGYLQWGPVNASSFPSGWTPSLTFTDNTIIDGTLNIAASGRPANVAIHRNTIDSDASWGRAISVQSDDIRPSSISENTTTEGLRVFLSGTLAEDWTVQDDGSQPWAVSSLHIPEARSVLIPAGTHLQGGRLLVSGTLEIRGTAEAPVRLDNPDDSWGGIELRGAGTLEARHLILGAEIYDVGISQTGSSYAWGDVTVSDSELTGGIELRPTLAGLTQDEWPHITLERNKVGGAGIEVSTGMLPYANVHIRDNVIDIGESGGVALLLRGSGPIDVDDLVSNSSLSPGTFHVVGSIGDDWTVPALPNVRWHPEWYVDDGAVVTVGSGVEFAEIGSNDFAHFGVSAGGSLELLGTEDAPLELVGIPVPVSGGQLHAAHVVFRGVESVYGGTAGGVTGYYDAELLLDDVVFAGLEQCLWIGSADVTGHLRGSVAGCEVGIDSIAPFDATNVDWGDPDGPAPFGTGAQALGNAEVIPWIGYVAPPVVETPRDTSTSQLYCEDVMVLAVRGSGEVPTIDEIDLYDFFTYTEMTAGAGQEARGLGSPIQQILTGQAVLEPGTVEDRGIGMLDSLPVSAQESTLVFPIRYPAANVSVLTEVTMVNDIIPLSKASEYLYSIDHGIWSLNRYLRAATEECANAEIVLAGYSQGAMVIHMLMAEYAATGKESILDRIAAVVLLSDPLQHAAAEEYTIVGSGLGRSYVDVAADSAAFRQLWSFIGTDRYVDALSARYPQSLMSRTWALCTYGDLMCSPDASAFSFEDMAALHTGYEAAELTDLGRRAVPVISSRLAN